MTDTFSSDEHLSAGQKLRKTRIERGVNLDEVARVTRITKGYLHALEEDALDKLPSEAYARGFFRIYANFLGLSAENLLGSSGHTGAGSVEAELPHATNQGTSECTGRRTSKIFLRSIVVVCLVALTGMYFLIDKSPETTTPKTDGPLNPSDKPIMASTKPELSSLENAAKNPLQDPVEKIDAPAIVSPVTDQGIVLKIRALQAGYLNLTIDDEISQHYDLMAGDLIEWKADKVFKLDLENAGGVEAELNGKLLKPFGKKGSPAQIVLSAGYNGEKIDR